ncbi:MAG: lysylphosphatidylglycerol synthase transmembrane domain-containing protein [Endomicrobiia bacterium]
MKFIKAISGLIISFVLLYLVFKKISFTELLSYIKNVKIGYLIVALFIGFFLLLFRSYRWRLIIKEYKNFGIPIFFEATVLGLFFNTILPFRMGDLIQGYVLSKKTAIPKSLTFSSVLMERFVDLFPPVVFIIIGSFFIVLPGQVSLFLSSLLLFFLVFGFYFILKFKKIVITTVNKLSTRIKLFQKINIFMKNFYIALENFKDKFLLGKVFSLTFLLWIGYSFNMWLICLSLDINLPSIMSSFLVQAITSLSVVIPSSPGYIGSWEFMGMLALSIFNIEKTKAVAFSLLSHIIGILSVVILGVIFVFKELNLLNYFKQEVKNET